MRVLVTGANRGLGLELVRQYRDDGARVLACCRAPGAAEALGEVARASNGRVTVHRLDVTDPDQIVALASELEGEAIDLLLNNAGVFPDKGVELGAVDVDQWLACFRTNTIAPLKVAEAFLEHVARSRRKVIAVVTSLMGSIADNTGGGCYMYRSSKAAVNMVVKSLAIDLAPRGITCLLIHPGWVRTDMGGAAAPLEASESVRGMRAVLAAAGPARSGRFFRYDGEEAPW